MGRGLRAFVFVEQVLLSEVGSIQIQRSRRARDMRQNYVRAVKPVAATVSECDGCNFVRRRVGVRCLWSQSLGRLLVEGHWQLEAGARWGFSFFKFFFKT